MDTSRQDFVREHKRTLRQADKRLEEALKTVSKGDKERVSHDKALQDAKDLSHLAHRELRALDNGDDATFAEDRSGFDVTMSKLRLALDSAHVS
jgi:hypothetical protein